MPTNNDEGLVPVTCEKHGIVLYAKPSASVYCAKCGAWIVDNRPKRRGNEVRI